MSYVAVSDFEDEMMKPLVQNSDLQAADEYVDAVARQKGVDPKRIPTNPVPAFVRQLAIAYACARRAKLKSGFNPAKFQGGDGGDAYEMKRRIYQAEVDRLTAQIQPVDLTGGSLDEVNPLAPFIINVYRS